MVPSIVRRHLAWFKFWTENWNWEREREFELVWQHTTTNVVKVTLPWGLGTGICHRPTIQCLIYGQCRCLCQAQAGPSPKCLEASALRSHDSPPSYVCMYVCINVCHVWVNNVQFFAFAQSSRSQQQQQRHKYNIPLSFCCWESAASARIVSPDKASRRSLFLWPIQRNGIVVVVVVVVRNHKNKWLHQNGKWPDIDLLWSGYLECPTKSPPTFVPMWKKILDISIGQKPKTKTKPLVWTEHSTKKNYEHIIPSSRLTCACTWITTAFRPCYPFPPI